MNWLILLGAIPTFLITGGLGIFLHNWDVSRLESRQEKALTEQAENLNKQCTDDKKTVENNNATLENDLSNYRSQLGALKRVRKPTCVVMPSTRATNGSPASGSTTELPRQDGVTSESLLDLAGDAESVRLQLRSCQDFVNQVWKANGQ